MGPKLSQNSSSKTVRLLQTFEVVARRLSVTKAAAELGVTTSAVSHQLRELTDTIGEKLTEKSGRDIALTAVGAKLASELADHFDRIEKAVVNAISGDTGRFRIAVCSAFGPSWLGPRFNDLIAENPQTEFQLVLKSGQPEPSDADADIFITTQPGGTGFWCAPLFDEVLVAVGSPALRQSDPYMRRSRFITTDPNESTLGEDWFDFVKHTRIPLELGSPHVWVKCTHYILALELARQGVGFALIPDFMASSDIESGKLALFNDARIPSGRQYNVCFKRSRQSDEAAAKTIAWIRDQCKSTTEKGHLTTAAG